MSGAVFAEFKKFIDSEYGSSLWLDVLCASNLNDRVYFPRHHYDEGELALIIDQVAQARQVPVQLVFQKFIEFLVGRHVKISNQLIPL